MHALCLQQTSSGFLDIHVTVVFIGLSHESDSIVHFSKVQQNLTITEISTQATTQTGASKYTKARLSKSLLWQLITSSYY